MPFCARPAMPLAFPEAVVSVVSACHVWIRVANDGKRHPASEIPQGLSPAPYLPPVIGVGLFLNSGSWGSN
jgi:hypothetical protein